MPDGNRPKELQVNAWTGGHHAVAGPNWSATTGWGLTGQAYRQTTKTLLRAGPMPDDRDWSHPEVGWGLVLPDNPKLTDAEQAAGVDAPAAIQKLLAARKAPVLRYTPQSRGRLVRYYADGQPSGDFDVGLSPRGTADNAIPKYLLIFAPPQVIPWRAQYALNMSSYVGRLYLEGDALERYVEALLTGWASVPCDALKPVVWSVNLGGDDITWLMQKVVATPVWQAFASDSELKGAIRLADADATIAKLAEVIAKTSSGLVITTSHGLTGPAAAPEVVRARLGGLVDGQEAVLSANDLADANAGGAIWYAHACCSAGSDDASQYEKLFAEGHAIGDTLRGVSKAAGAMIAPLPQALLGAKRPLRAFVGHVEPTFDWTLRDPFTGQVVTAALTFCLYNALYQQQPWPIGYAMAKIFAQAGDMLSQYVQSIDDVNKNVLGARDQATYRQIAALDRQSIVILGDPTVTLALDKV